LGVKVVEKRDATDVFLHIARPTDLDEGPLRANGFPNGQVYPRLQHIIIVELLDGKKPQMPPTVLPYIAADKLTAGDESQAPLF